MMNRIFLLLFLILNSNFVFAKTAGAYLIPRQIFVGDPATLVLPLPPAESNSSDLVITFPSEYLPSDPDIDFHRIILERRTVGSRLLIEFTPFVPGVLELPVIQIGDEIFTELVITVNSLIKGKESPVLSGAASTLAIPGTALMLYGSLAAVVIILILAFLFMIKGRAFLERFIERWKHQRLFSALRKTAKRLHKEVFKGADKRLIIDKLSDEFRIFLSQFTGNNCRAMTAREFENIPAAITVQEESDSSLSGFFRTCDDLRFSGENINSKDLFGLLDEMKHFLVILENEAFSAKFSEAEDKQKEEAA